MRFSLIVATVGRTEELRRLLDSVDRQAHRDCELIVIDQNLDDRLLPILNEFEGRLEVRRVTSRPGVSRARNLGLREAAGEIICFPDDDCWYSDGLLEQVNTLLTENLQWDGVIGESVDASGNRTLPWSDRAGSLTLAMSWRQAVTYCYFFRSKVVRHIGGFDEELGLGSGLPWGSGADNDYMLRAIESGFHIQYEPAVRIHHPLMFHGYDARSRQKKYSYSLGDGRLLRKHPMPAWWVMLFFAVPLARTGFSVARLNTAQMLFHWLTFYGRLRGFVVNRRPPAARVSSASE